MYKKLFIFIAACLFFSVALHAQKGSLFIIGGGYRTKSLMQEMINTAQLKNTDHIAILPMSGAEPDTSFFYIRQDLDSVCTNTVSFLNFTKDKVNDKEWLDSLKNAKLVFITGGDQSRFMKAVWNTPVYNAIHEAYNNGAVIAGTSAGAAVMSKHMITGNQLRGDTVYHATFDRLWKGNIEFEEGLGLLDSIIIDQHFIVRSRYNRMISALAAFPSFTCIGIDEATAIIVHNHTVKVAGESQVIVMQKPQGIIYDEKGLIKLKNADISIYTTGDSFIIGK
ncbi:cyanophycinase [Panacibacter ginsenosidivorans]|uniref:Cyanophycinase n=1 Tax=Panacibacter ginsenosidivorans TaxID=1813871 RepID=A0A5B8V7S1_9BACT|nr:cyanophycinase [Panacibacter ginsenosidivorans]QEC67215.1 cyanophycinase [Panacibacter ginsenosidivorans]